MRSQAIKDFILILQFFHNIITESAYHNPVKGDVIMEEKNEYTNTTDNINTDNNTEPEHSGEATVNEAERYDRYDKYAPEGAGCAWNGSSYSGRPAQDREYSTYNHEYTVKSEQQEAIPDPAPEAERVPNPEVVEQRSDQGYTYYGSRPGYSYVSSPVMKKVNEKKPLPRFLQVALMAVLFGVIGAGTFYGSTVLIERIAANAANEARPADEGAVAKATQNLVRSGEADKLKVTKLSDIVDSTPTDVSAVVGKVKPSMVQINCTFLTNSFFGSYESTGAGSGIIIGKTDTELLIATNNHVVENAVSISVTLNDGTEVAAISKGTDATADLAVVAVDLNELSDETQNAVTVATIGDSNTVEVGQMAVVIGNAMGYGQSTTVGYISQKEHEVTVDNQVMVLLQTDAAINPGNSGGALINLDGEVIGIPSVKFASSSIEGMGFAIPISRAIDILKELGSREILKDADKGYLNILMRTVPASTAEFYNWPLGVYVSEVTEGGAADKAGILPGDIITEVGGIKVEDSATLKSCITSYRYGTKITITLQRMDKGEYKPLTVEAVLEQNPDYVEKE